jgi:RNA polymerase sigma-70 factor (ECF subfamily)
MTFWAGKRPAAASPAGSYGKVHGVAAASEIDRFLPELYDELRRLAAGVLRGQRPNHTLQPTALVHEAYLKLVASAGGALADRTHLLATAARAMRQILVDHARARATEKRGGGAVQVTLSLAGAAVEPSAFDLLAFDEALRRLEALDGQQVRVVELRYLVGLSVEEVAEVLGVSAATVKRDTAMAKAWLVCQLRTGN